jgi:hypothetical protein
MKLFGNPIKGLVKTALLCGCVSVMGVTQLFAVVPVYTGTLADLVASGFSYQVKGLTSFDPTQIIVTATQDSSGIDYLTWSGDISLVTAGIGTADLKLNYIVTATVGSIVMIDQAYTGSA